MVKVVTSKVRNVSTIICTWRCRYIYIYIANISRGRKTKMKDWDYCQILTRKNDWRSVKPYIARLKGFTFSFFSMTAPSPTRRNMHAKILRACKLMIIGEEYEFRKKNDTYIIFFRFANMKDSCLLYLFWLVCWKTFFFISFTSATIHVTTTTRRLWLILHKILHAL